MAERRITHRRKSGPQAGSSWYEDALRPLFASYLFFAGGWDAINAAREAGRLYRGGIIKIKNQIETVRQLKSIEMALALNPALGAIELKIGQRVRVVRGPFQGQIAHVQKIKGNSRVVLPMATLGQAVDAEIDCADVEPI